MTGRLTCALVAGTIATVLSVSAWAETDFNSIVRGRYLVAAGDCQDCHTPAGGKPFEGGRPLQTPFGTIYSANITPDRETGIGTWTADQFYRAMHEGVDAGGHNLYPAFPYPYYTRVTHQDVADIRAYLQTIAPVKSRPQGNRLPFPLNQRPLMSAWNWMFFKPGDFKPEPAKSAQWNRGAYLVEGLGHCGACHTPKNIAGADNSGDRLGGGKLENWLAPNLGSDLHAGLGNWSTAQIVEYLKTGRNALSQATGPMADVVQYSTSKLDDNDLSAIAAYLKDLPGQSQGRNDNGGSKPSVAAGVASAGREIYADQCAECHGSNGAGEPTYFPPLAKDNNVQQSDPTTVIRVILSGARTVPTDSRPTPLSMPAFDWKLSDEQVAAVATYVRNSWGNAAAPVTAAQVGSVRKAIQNAAD